MLSCTTCTECFIEADPESERIRKYDSRTSKKRWGTPLSCNSILGVEIFPPHCCMDLIWAIPALGNCSDSREASCGDPTWPDIRVLNPAQLPQAGCIERNTDAAIPSRRTAPALDMVPACCAVTRYGHAGSRSRLLAGSSMVLLLCPSVIGRRGPSRHQKGRIHLVEVPRSCAFSFLPPDKFFRNTQVLHLIEEQSTCGTAIHISAIEVAIGRQSGRHPQATCANATSRTTGTTITETHLRAHPSLPSDTQFWSSLR